MYIAEQTPKAIWSTWTAWGPGFLVGGEVGGGGHIKFLSVELCVDIMTEDTDV